MERFPSLINSLKAGFEEGRPVAELLSLLNEMRNELTRSVPASDHTLSPVSVWLPAGYQPGPQPSVASSPAANVPDAAEEISEISPIISTDLKDSLHLNIPDGSGTEAMAVFESFIKPEAPVGIPSGVPRPPLVPRVEVEEEYRPLFADPEPEPLPDDDDFLLPGKFHVQPGGIFRETGAEKTVNEAEFSSEAPVVVELELPADDKEWPVQEDLRPKQAIITENFLKSNTQSVAERPLELHEILANRVVAKPETVPLPAQGRVLADTLAGGKIQDLRKAIAINDRFRFINSLFRGDDTLFERSVKTINNFNILQEAQYWIQRELVIKLGWNEEDELVQMFYQLVSRRFL